MARRASVMPPIFLLALIVSVGSVSFAEERALYMVLMEGDPVAFHGGSRISSREEGRRLDPNSEVFKAHAKRLVDSHDQLLQSALETGSYSKLYSFKHIVNGFAVHTTPSQISDLDQRGSTLHMLTNRNLDFGPWTLELFSAKAEKLKAAAGVKLVERDRGAKLMTTYTPEFLGLPQGAWTHDGGDDRSAGEGIVIGFVDSGINPTHPSFAYDPLHPFTGNISHFLGSCETGPRFPASSCNGKIVSAKFFSAGAEAAATLNSTVDFLSPFDAVGHGSHVASTAAGNAGVPVVVNGYYYGEASGMAPRARIAMYKAVYPTVGTLTDVVSAIDQAILDGVDILTLSVGPDEPPEDTVTFLSAYDIAMLSARRAGVFVVQATGNQGPGISSVVSYSPWAVGVASSGTDRTYPGSILLGNGTKIEGVGLSGPTFGYGLLLHKLVLAKDAVMADGTFPRTSPYVEECQYPEALDHNVVLGSIVICTFSEGFYNRTSTLTAIINTAKGLGFMGFILVANPAYGDFIAEPIPFAVPGILVPNLTNSQVILQYYEQETHKEENGFATRFAAKAAIGEGRVASFMGQAPVVSRFSSRGPDFVNTSRTPCDVLKPDILAPGHQIWAAWSPVSASEPALTGYNFALQSGTSMATPHVAGIAALVKQYNPSWTPSMIASAISTTATKYDKNGELIMAEGSGIGSTYPSSHFDFGAGLVSPSRALDPGLVLPSGYEDYISFLCSLPEISPAAIRNATGEPCNNTLDHPANLNLPSITISALRGSQIVRRIFNNVGSKPETYVCSAVSPNGTIVDLCPTWFRIAPQGIQELYIQVKVTQAMDDFTFGEIVLTGSLNHIVRIPLSVFPISISK